MPTLTVTKIFHFEYAHFLPDYDGKCKDIHGHSGVLGVEVSGPPINYYSPEGMICDFSILSKIVNEKIISNLDHTFINKLPKNKFRDYWNSMLENPTAENIINWIVGELVYLFNENLVRVRLWETKDSYAEWRAYK